MFDTHPSPPRSLSRRLRALSPVASALSLPSPSRSLPSPNALSLPLPPHSLSRRLCALSPVAFALSLPLPLRSLSHRLRALSPLVFAQSPLPSRPLHLLSLTSSPPIGIALTFPPSLAIALTFPPPIGIALTFPPSLAIALTFPPPLAIALIFPPPLAIALTFPPPLAIALTFPRRLAISPVASSPLPFRRSLPFPSHPVVRFLSPPIPSFASSPLPSRRSLPFPSHPVVPLLSPPILSFASSPLPSRRSPHLPSHPVVRLLSSPIPSFASSPLPSRRSLPFPSHPVVRLLSPPIATFASSPLPSRRSPPLPSHPVVRLLSPPIPSFASSPLPSRRSLPLSNYNIAPRDVPTRGRRNADRAASSRSPEATTYDEDEDDADYNEEAYGTDDDADSGEEPDKGMSDSDAESDDDDAPEESQPATPPVRRGHGKAAPGDKSATVGGEPHRRAPKTREPMLVKRSVWSPTESTILVAALWFMKDELEPLLGKQGSQYWARLVRHIETENTGWACGVNAVQKQWRNLVQMYKQLQKGDKASGNGVVCKPPWWPYMVLFQNNRAVAAPHAVAAGGATHVNAPCGFAVPSTSAPCTSTPTFTGVPFSVALGVFALFVAETATMAAAKLVSDTIKDCHADAMAKVEGLVRAWMQQDAEIARARNQSPAPPPPTVNGAPADAATQPASAAAEGDDGVWFRRGDHGGGEATPDEAEEVWVRGDAV
ncbi:unnamed protein product [Closterium sp. NIES-64]|nr:unnamed protein product [Closterium sp. NIES-64]